MSRPVAAELIERLAAAGFLSLGGFDAEDEASLPELQSGRAAKSLLLIGSTGPTLWDLLLQSPEMADGAPDPLDRYTRRVLTALATESGFEAVFSFDGPPYHPFQQWALRCGGFSQSPMGVLAHHDYGPWTGFRAAFLSPAALPFESRTGAPGPCETCVEKPCLTACPVGALSLETGYDVPKCRDHLIADQSVDCWSGCRARRACPFGTAHRQVRDNARFHMDRFVGV